MSIKLPIGSYFGEKLGEQRSTGLILSEYRYLPQSFIERHCHEHTYLSLVLRGTYTETTGGVTTECIPSAVVLHPEGEEHANRFYDCSVRVFNLEISMGWLEPRGINPVLSLHRWQQEGGFASRLMHSLYQEFRCQDTLSSLAIEGLTLELVAYLYRQTCSSHALRPPRWLEEIKALLDNHFIYPMTLTEMATDAKVHPTHLARLFHRYYRSSIGEYIRVRRVEFACTLLAQTEDSLAVIAQSAGFSDQSHFGRAFKEHYGTTPAAYRQSLIGSNNLV